MTRPLLHMHGCSRRLLQHGFPKNYSSMSSIPVATITNAHHAVRRSSSSKAKSAKMSEEDIQDFKDREPIIKQELRQQAAFLTKSLYRTCLRSVRLIRPGNEHDDEEFKRREEQMLDEEKSPRRDDDVRMGMFSMAPPVDREDELRSRAEYYHQFARENLVQETDCMPLGDNAIAPLHQQDVQRFLFLLKKGDSDRRWLLQDMIFPDPFKKAFPTERAKQFEEKALAYTNESLRAKASISGAYMFEHEFGYDAEDEGDAEDGDSGDADFDEDGEEVPAWLREKFPHHLGPKQS